MDFEKDFIVQNCVRWTTETPKLGYRNISEVFHCRGFETHFEIFLSRLKPWYYLYIVTNNGRAEMEAYNIHCYIEFPNGGHEFFCRVTVGNPRQSITSYEKEILSEMMEEVNMESLPLVFLFEDVELKLPIRFDTNSPRNCFQILSADIGKLRHETNHDILLESRQGDQHPAHTVILCARAKKFQETLQGWNFVGRQTPNRFRIDDIDKETLEEFLHYCYHGMLSREPTLDLAERLYSASLKYGVDALAKKCRNCLVEALNPDNIYGILVLAHKCSDQELEESVVSYLFKNNLLSSERWKVFRQQWVELAFKIYHRFYLSKSG